MDDDLFPPFEAPDISHLDKLFARIFGAVHNGDIDSLKAIRSTETELFKEHLRTNGGLLLYEAVRMGLYDVGEFLLANGCSLRRCLGMTSSALHLAAANPDAADFLERLTMYSSNCVDVLDIRYNTPLHVASACNNVRGVETLLKHEAEVNLENESKKYPLDLALAGGHVDCVSLLLEKCGNFLETTCFKKVFKNYNLADHPSLKFVALRARTQMDIAAKALFDLLGHRNVLLALRSLHTWDKPRANEILEEIQSILNLSEDVLSSVKRRLQCIDLLIEKNLEFNMLELSLKHLSDEYYLQAVKSLVEDYSVPVNGLFHAPLHLAVDRSDFEGVKYLLDSGADVNKELFGMTPLEIALQKRVIDEDIARLLVERGAQINIIRSDGWCPLKGVLQRHNESLAQFLVDHGADVDLKNPITGLTIFLEKVYTTTSINYSRRVMSFLLENGASLIDENSNMTPLHYVASVQTRLHTGCVDYMKLLIKYSKDVNPVDFEGNTPLMKAIEVPYHSLPIIRLLLESGADPKIRNSAGKSALDLAIMYRKVDVIDLFLMEHCVDYDADALFTNKTALLDTIIINLPYNRDELFAMRAFLVRQDVARERRSLIDKFLSTSRKPGCNYLDDMFVCLHEILRCSPLEKSVMAYMTSGPTVLFSDVEHYVLKRKLSTQVNETNLRGVLEYRIVVNDSDCYISACDREIRSLKEHSICPGITLSFLLLPEPQQLLLLSIKPELYQALNDVLSYTKTPEMLIASRYPIFGVTLFRMITDILAKADLLSAAAIFFNRYISRLRDSASQFKSLPQHILDNIFSYLSKEDLSKLVFLEDDISPASIELLKKSWKNRLAEFLRTPEVTR